MGKTLPITFNKGNCGRLKNNEIICGKFVGRPGRQILLLFFFFWGGVFFLVVWGFRAARFCCCSCHVSDTSAEPQRSLNIYIHGPRQTAAAKSSRAPTSAHEHIYMCIYKYRCLKYAAASG